MEKIYIGIDVSKNTLDVSTPNEVFKCNNNKTGFKLILKKISKLGSSLHCVCESTGGYELSMALFLAKNGIVMSIENATKTKYFMSSMGQKAKTDKIDAVGLRLYGERQKPHEWRVPTEEELMVKALYRRREECVEMCAKEKVRFKQESFKCIKNRIDKHIKQLEKEILKLEKELSIALHKDEKTTKMYDAITEIRGCGDVTAISVITQLPEIGTLTRGGVAALVGLAPYNRDSGLKNGKRSIRGGRKILRDKLYMSTMHAMQHNDVIKAFADKLTDKGKPFKVAMIACMRKLLIHINAKIKKACFST